jgi:CheY-like chemotaxis protein
MPSAKSTAPRSRVPRHDVRSLKYGIVSISAAGEDHSTLHDILNDCSWCIVKSRTCKAAFARLRRQHMPVVVCESNLPDGTWRDVLDRIKTLPYQPLLIGTSRTADHRLWAEVLNSGGYNVLAKPFRESEVKQVFASLRTQGHRQLPQRAAAGAA